METPTGLELRVPDCDFAQRVQRALAPSEWRVLVAMANGLSDHEIAQAFGLSVNTIKIQLQRGRTKAALLTRAPVAGWGSGRRLVALLTGFVEAT